MPGQGRLQSGATLALCEPRMTRLGTELLYVNSIVSPQVTRSYRLLRSNLMARLCANGRLSGWSRHAAFALPSHGATDTKLTADDDCVQFLGDAQSNGRRLFACNRKDRVT
jgi:hypothetical protein